MDGFGWLEKAVGVNCGVAECCGKKCTVFVRRIPEEKIDKKSLSEYTRGKSRSPLLRARESI